MKQIFILAQKSLRKSLRNKIFIVFFLFAVMIVFLSILFSLLTFTAEVKIIKDVGLAGISIFSSLIAIFLSGEAVVGEVEKKTIYILLSKPADRAGFIVGSWLGIILTAGVAILINGAVLVFLIYLRQNFVEPGIFLAISFMELEIIIITSIGILFSSFSSSALTGTLLCLFVYLLGHLNPQLYLLTKLVDRKIIKGFISLICWILPNLEYFNLREKVVKGYPLPDVIYIGRLLLYTFFYSAICLVIAHLLFQRKEL